LSACPSRWKYSPEELAAAVASSRSYRQVLGVLGLSQSGGGAYATLQKRVAQMGLDTSHFLGRGWNAKNWTGNLRSQARPLEELLVVDSDYLNTGRLKSRLLSAGLLENRCALCGLPPSWNQRPLVMRLDHVNGIRTDNRLQNLRLVCPNCDSQLPTFAGRNARRCCS